MYVEANNRLRANPFATDLYEMLKARNYPPRNHETKPIAGTVYITNANDEQETDLTFVEIDYIWKKMEKKGGKITKFLWEKKLIHWPQIGGHFKEFHLRC